MLNCVYHPVEKMKVVSDEERVSLLATGTWFDTPNEAKQLRKDYERRIQQAEKPRKRKSKLSSKDDGIGTHGEQRICEGASSDDGSYGCKSS